jgi:hypothetical protein
MSFFAALTRHPRRHTPEILAVAVVLPYLLLPCSARAEEQPGVGAAVNRASDADTDVRAARRKRSDRMKLGAALFGSTYLLSAAGALIYETDYLEKPAYAMLCPILGPWIALAGGLDEDGFLSSRYARATSSEDCDAAFCGEPIGTIVIFGYERIFLVAAPILQATGIGLFAYGLASSPHRDSVIPAARADHPSLLPTTLGRSSAPALGASLTITGW